MAQLNFERNISYVPTGGPGSVVVQHNSYSFFPFIARDSISWKTINLWAEAGWNSSSNNRSFTYNLGLYYLTGSTLSLANSASATASVSMTTDGAVMAYWLSVTATSATQNLLPGLWFIGYGLSMNPSSAGGDLNYLGGYSNLAPANAFPNAFIGGNMTVSTNALPASIATSDLNTTGSNAMSVPYILLSS